MSSDFDWQCPFCGNHSTITDERYSSSSHKFDDGNKYGDLMWRRPESCGNCRSLWLSA